MSNQPIVFNIRYTPYKLPKGATAEEIEKHIGERAFFDMTGGKNVYDYITTEGKRTGKLTALEYLQKNTGVFNDKGMISKEQVEEMKERLKANEGNIWHGFISLNEEESHKIDTPEKCVELIKRTFPTFLQDERFHKDNVDLMCALHLDRPHHLHIHFVFWEKEPKYKDKLGELKYRRVGKIGKKSIDNMFVRMGLWLESGKDRLYKSRDEAIKTLRSLTGVKAVSAGREDIKKEIIALAKDLPKTGRISYGSKDMEPYRARMDKIVTMLLSSDSKARRANRKFYEALAEREQQVKNICAKNFSFSNSRLNPGDIKNESPKYHNEIDESGITFIADIEADYKRRQGNLVLKLAKFIKPELWERKRKYKPSDIALKRRLGMSRNKVTRAVNKFFKSFGDESELLERDFSHRLQDIEEEIERENKAKNGSNSESGETK